MITLSPQEISGRKNRLTKLWLDKSSPDLAVEFHYYTDNIQRLGSPADRYAFNLEFIEKNSEYPGVYVPVYLPWFGATFQPEFFGAETIISQEGGQPWAKPLIIDNPGDVYRIKLREPTDVPVFRKLQAEVEYVRRNFPDLPVRLHAVGGPLDTCCQLWKEEKFYLAMYDHPVEVEYLLEYVTEGIIQTLKWQMDIISGPVTLTWPMVWAPLQAGVGISEDQLAVCSPDLYRKYVLKHLNRISRAFNGLTIHSCGNFEHNLANLAQVEHLNGLNFSICQNGSFRQGTQIERVVKYLPDTVLLPAFTYQGQDRFPAYVNYVEHVIEQTQGKNRVILTVEPHVIDTSELNRTMGALDEYQVGI